MKKQTQWCFAIMLAGMPFWSSAQLLKGKADGRNPGVAGRNFLRRVTRGRWSIGRWS